MARDTNVIQFAHHALARDAGHAEARGDAHAVARIEAQLHRLTGAHPLPESLHMTWARAFYRHVGVLAFAVVFALTLPACGGALEPVRVDESFSAEEAAAVIAAVDEWCEATDGGVCPGAIIARRDGDAISLRPGVLAGREAGREQLQQIMLDVEQLAEVHADADAFAHAVKVVAMHEIGHALGLPHASTGLMREDVSNEPACVDERTLAAVCLEYECGPNTKPCAVADTAVAL
jgi:hypothetical protein